MKVILLGAGPGDPGLLTLRGRDELAKADVVVYDALANNCFLQYSRKDAELIYVGKVADQHALPQDKINELLAAKAREGKTVVRLKGGDPYIFGRGGEEAEYLALRHIPFEVVPGISSAIAVPAYAGIPLTQRNFASSLTIITGHENPDKKESAHNWQALAQSGSTLVFVMGMRNLPQIAEKLINAGMDPLMPAAVIYRGTTPLQRSVAAPLRELPIRAREENFSNPAIIVIGKVTSLMPLLDWYGQKPLLGKTIVVTRAREQASELSRQLLELGALALECPVISVKPLANYAQLDEALANLGQYAWVIFTSANGVRYFWERLERRGLDSRALPLVAAIGGGTSAELKRHGIIADLVPADYVAESLADALVKKAGTHLEGMKFLLARAAEARQILPEQLAAAGAAVDVAPVYETEMGGGNLEEVKNLLARGALSCITFTSSSTVNNFLRLIDAQSLRDSPETALAAIGPVTARTLAKYGLKADITAQEYSIPGLVQAIVDFYRGKPEK